MHGEFFTVREIAPPRPYNSRQDNCYSLELCTGSRVRACLQTDRDMMLYRSSHTKINTIVFLAKCETNLLIKGISSNFATITTIIIYYNDFASITCVHTLLSFIVMFKKTSHLTLFDTLTE